MLQKNSLTFAEKWSLCLHILGQTLILSQNLGLTVTHFLHQHNKKSNLSETEAMFRWEKLSIFLETNLKFQLAFFCDALKCSFTYWILNQTTWIVQVQNQEKSNWDWTSFLLRSKSFSMSLLRKIENGKIRFCKRYFVTI